MRGVAWAVIAAIVGAAAFHLYYLGLSAASRCPWDHPLSGEQRASCVRAASDGVGYSKRARGELNGLIDNVTE